MKMESLEGKHWVVIILIVIAAFLAAGLSVYQYIDAVSKDKKNDKLQNDLIMAQNIALVKADKLELANNEVKEKANELIKTQNELATLQQETLKRVMGHGYARILIGQINPSECKLFVESASVYPLYETEIVIYDQDKINSCPKILQNGELHIMLNCYNGSGFEFPIFTLNAGKMRPLGYTKPLGDDLHLLIKITTKHATTFQYSICRFNNATKKINHFYRIFEIKDLDFHLLERDKLESDDNIFERIFQFKKEIKIAYD